MSPTALEVMWDEPDFPGITGYRVYYNMFAVPDMEKWDSMEIVGPYTVAEIGALESHTVYAVRVRAKGQDGRWGNYSEIVTLNPITPGQSKLGILDQTFFIYCKLPDLKIYPSLTVTSYY